MGLRSSPSIFNRFADAVCWIIRFLYLIHNLIHYADDFFLASTQDLQQAKAELQVVISAFQHLGIPIALDKLVTPSTKITYLGIDIDSELSTISIPDEKYLEIMAVLPMWRDRKKCTKKELLSIIGKLSFVCKIVRPGRIFLRRLITLSTSVTKLHHHITMNNEARADIQWWIEFLPSWSRCSIIPDPTPTYSDALELFTDASFLGLGAIFRNQWIQAEWPEHLKSKSIDFMELFAILTATITWGSHFRGKRIVFISTHFE